jgi:hypothetical protein
MSFIEVDGTRYKVVENMGYQNGHYVKAVSVNGEDRVVVKQGKKWSFATPIASMHRTGTCVGQ